MLRRALLAALPGLLALLAIVAPLGAQPIDPSFRLVNNTARAINALYASPSTDRAWGHDRLGAEVVPPGGRQVIRLPVGTCIWDIRIVYQGGGAEERRGLNTCQMTDLVFGGGGAAPRNAQQGNPSFNLVNQSGRAIAEFYASPSSQGSWGPDRLPQGSMVAPGQSVPVRLPQGECSYDIRTVWADGQAQERRGVNTCAMVNYVVR